MNIFCPNPPVDCADPSLPVVNYSSEAQDNETFFGRFYNPGLEPPLGGGSWVSTGCIGTCTSTISQADANLCAARQLITCLSDEWPELEDNPNDDPDQPPVVPRPSDTFSNDEQTATFTCEDGSTFSYTIPAGTVFGFSKAAANATALSLAQNGAINNRVCIGELTPEGACVLADYTTAVTVTSPRLNQPGYSLSVTVTSGDIPSGTTLTVGSNSFTISGIPDTAGTYTFIVLARVMQGATVISSISKTFSIYAVEITPDALTSGAVGNAYNDSVSTLGPTLGTVSWAVTAGALPDGLSLNTSSGAITGTPTLAGTFSFTITMTDER